ncbi:MAG: hypothetical protein U1F67_23370 [Rubrivivax sp.]
MFKIQRLIQSGLAELLPKYPADVVIEPVIQEMKFVGGAKIS